MKNEYQKVLEVEKEEYQETLNDNLIEAIEKVGLSQILWTLQEICHNEADHHCLNDKDELKNNWHNAAEAIREATENKIDLLTLN